MTHTRPTRQTADACIRARAVTPSVQITENWSTFFVPLRVGSSEAAGAIYLLLVDPFVTIRPGLLFVWCAVCTIYYI